MGNMTMVGQLIPPGEAALVAVLGYLVVFAGLILLMFVVMGLGRCGMLGKEAKPAHNKEDRARKASVAQADKIAGMPREAAMMAAVIIMESTSGNPMNKEQK